MNRVDLPKNIAIRQPTLPHSVWLQLGFLKMMLSKFPRPISGDNVKIPPIVLVHPANDMLHTYATVGVC